MVESSGRARSWVWLWDPSGLTGITDSSMRDLGVQTRRSHLVDENWARSHWKRRDGDGVEVGNDSGYGRPALELDGGFLWRPTLSEKPRQAPLMVGAKQTAVRTRRGGVRWAVLSPGFGGRQRASRQR